MEEQNELEKRLQEWKDRAEKVERANMLLSRKYHLLLEIYTTVLADRIEEIDTFDFDEGSKRELYYGTNMND